uniref:DUF6534 domain-containing protein n=1 Tax=Kwoniella bestiolae CBS 10118 TaxID=1296100 RepID=A0A1B9GCZ3_9TREE|nr:hypothetical protein I302_00383 [Kwoniella bestiolae CBS 10118]OCF28893.1 hypothetical protein I302_00383 [Kwoniella bestiolae CBS 10118]
MYLDSDLSLGDATRVREYGGPFCGGPIALQLAASVPETSLMQEDLLEAGLKELIGPHNGLFMAPILIGFGVDIFLAGIMLKQLTLWWKYAREDRWFIKILMGWCTVFGIIGTVFNLAFCFHIFVYNYGRYTTLAEPSWSSWLGIISPLTSAGVQIFYTDRAYKLSGQNKPLALTILAAILLSVTGGIGSKVTSVSNADPATAGAMAADFIITTAILWFLSRSKSGWVVTDKVVSKLLAISAESQLPPTLLAIAFLIIFAYKTTKAAASPDKVVIDVTSNLTIFFMMVIPKTYIVGFLAVLNARTSLRAVFSSSNEQSSGRRKTEPHNPRKPFTPTLGNFRERNEGDKQVGVEDVDVESLRRVGAGWSEAGSKTGLTWPDHV